MHDSNVLIQMSWLIGVMKKKSCILIVELGKRQISQLVYISFIFIIDIKILTIQTRENKR